MWLDLRVENGGSEQISVCNCDHSSLMERDHKARFTPGVKSMVQRMLSFHDFQNPFNFLLNFLNIYKYHFHILNQCP
jgi:hypothetical protein